MLTKSEVIKRLASLIADLATNEVDSNGLRRRLKLILNALEPKKLEGVQASATSADGEAVKRLFEAWQKKSGRVRSKLSPMRRKKIAARLREGYSEADIMRAIDGAMASAYHVENGYLDIELICRSAEKLEQFLVRAGSAPTGVISETKIEALSRAARDALKDGRREEYEQIQGEIAKRREAKSRGS